MASQHERALVGFALTLCAAQASGQASGHVSPQCRSTLVPFQAPSIALAAFDSDGAPDLAGIGAYRLEVGLNGGHGVFSDFHSQILTYLASSSSTLAGDLDGDGLMDLVSFTGPVSLWSGHGDGTFDLPVVIAGTFSLFGDKRALLVDLDHDGDLDLAAAFAAGALAFLHNDGAGGFSFSNVVAPAAPITDLDYADFTGDGIEDLLVADSNAQIVRLYTSVSPGVHQSAGTLSIGRSRIACGDLDGDGDRDLVACDPWTATGQLFRNDLNGSWTPTATVSYSRSVVRDVAIEDFNFDGRADVLVVGDGPLGVLATWLDAPAYGGTLSRTSMLGDPTPASTAYVADFDSDGRLDLGVAGPSGVAIHRGLGDGRFANNTLDPAGASCVGVERGDFNGDGAEEFAFIRSSGVVDYSEPSLATWFASQRVSASAAGDLDGDGLDEIVALNHQGGLSIRFPALAQTRSSATASDMYGVEVADIDSDGDLDIAVVAGQRSGIDDTPYVWWNENDGAGNLALPVPIDMGVDVRSVALVDLNLDGLTDIATVGQSALSFQCRVSVRLGVPGGFAPAQIVYAPNLSAEIAARDLDGDGLPELVVVGTGTFNVSVYPNLGGAFATPIKYDYEARSDVGAASPTSTATAWTISCSAPASDA